jgi:hypothetical protein
VKTPGAATGFTGSYQTFSEILHNTEFVFFSKGESDEYMEDK